MSSKRAWALLCLSAAGCAAQVEGADQDQEIGVNEQAIMGGTDYVGCTAEERGKLRSGAIMGRIIASSTTYAQCIDTIMRYGDGRTGPYVYSPGDRSAPDVAGHVANVVQASRASYPAAITCADLAEGRSGEAYIDLWMHEHPDAMRIDHGFLASPLTTPASVASVLWHEAMHTQGYHHGSDALKELGGQYNNPGISDTVPYIVNACMTGVNAQRPASCVDGCPRGARYGLSVGYFDASGNCTCIRDPLPSVPFGAGGPADGPSPLLDLSEANDHFGETLARGDFDGDGLTDVAVGAPYEGTDLANTALAGSVYVYHGTTFGQLFPDKVLNTSGFALTPVNGDKFGAALAAADFDDDGYTDLAVGAPGRTGNQGRVYLYRGSSGGLVTEREMSQSGIASNENGDRFGQALATRWTGSGWDLVVGAPGERIGTNGASGYVYVFHRALSGLVEPTFSFGQSGADADESGDEFGASLATGRIDNDQVDDIAIGAPGEDNSAGAAFAFSTENGSTTGFARKYKLPAPAGSLLAGQSVAIGHFLSINNGAVAVGIPVWDLSTQRGGVAVYLAHRTVPETTPQQRLHYSWQSTTNSALAGTALVTVRPISSGGMDRLAVGASGGAGSVQILTGASDRMQVGPVIDQSGLDLAKSGDAFGYSLAFGPDGLGQYELIVGAPGDGAGKNPSASGSLNVFRLGVATFRPVQYHAQNE